MRRRSSIVGALAVSLALGMTGVARAASPGSSSVGPGASTRSWSGHTFVLGSTASPSLCPESTDSQDLLCDHYDLTVSVTSGYWSSHTGGVTVSIG